MLNEGTQVNERVCLHELENSRPFKFSDVESAASGVEFVAEPYHYQDQSHGNEFEDLKGEEEDRSTGSITWKLYWKFFRTSLAAPVVFCLFLLVLGVKGKRISRKFSSPYARRS